MRKKQILAWILICVILLSGCTEKQVQKAEDDCVPDPVMKAYSASFLELFDTVTYVKGYAKDEEDFRKTVQEFHDRLLEFHQLFDIYNDYEGVINIKYLNDHAGETVTVSPLLMDLLLFSEEIAEMTGGKVDITLGAVLALWHEAREESINDPENAYLPDAMMLKEAKNHTGFDKLELDAENNTVRFLDPLLRLDVGALAKGYAAQQACADMPTGLLVSVGGNVIATGPKADTGSSWTVGIQDPLGETNTYLHTISLVSGSVVSSGDYQRRYTCNGKEWHHIIDPETLYPSELWHGVTVICSDSGIADGLSTALFLSSMEEGKKLLKKYGAEAVWMDLDGKVFYSEGYEKYIK